MAFAKKYDAYAIKMIKQLSILGSLLTWVNLSRRLVAKPTARPMTKEPKKTSKKTPILSKKLNGVNVPAFAPVLYFCAVSKSTMAIASFRMLSPKMTVYNFGSTL